MSLLKVRNLNISIKEKNIISDVSFSLDEGKIFGIVGESGCGKSTLLRAVLGILPNEAKIAAGRILYRNEDLQTISPQKMRQIRGGQIGMIFQNAKTTFCPVRTIGQQLWETLREHRNCTKEEAFAMALDLFAKIRLKNGEKILQSYPFELSGGMNQRVAIAMAMLLKPKLLLADEPTSALDVVSQAQVMEEMIKLQQMYSTSIILVSHNINLVRQFADKIAVMQKGHFVENGTTEEIINNPKHNYTRKLLQSIFYL